MAADGMGRGPVRSERRRAGYAFDEQGNLLGAPGSAVDDARPSRRGGVRQDELAPCDIATLNGSWLLELTERGATLQRSLIRGPLRIEVGAARLLVSGDIYVLRIPPNEPNPMPAPTPPMPWYPQLPQREYSWHLRSAGATYASGELSLPFTRHLWDRLTQEFVSSDTGRLTLTCQRGLVETPGEPTVMTGVASVGATTYDARATKTSDLQRGCRIEVDLMTGRQWPATATMCNGAITTFESVYAAAGWDVSVTVDEIDVPEDAALTNAELQTLLTGHRGAATGPDEWRLWLLTGSTQGGLFGIMFDDDTVPREGAVGFADVMMPSAPQIQDVARGRPLDEVPAAFLRTLVHEAGHALNLFHPKHDIHDPPIGTEIMNQTGDVIGFATPANPYPCNATMLFGEHDRMSLLHAPDPQVKPGWKNFGWGHGDLSSGLPEPVDAEGLASADDAEGLQLGLSVPDEVFSGEYVVATVTLTNTGDRPRDVTTRLNLAEGDLIIGHATPSGNVGGVRDVVLGCGPRPTVVLQPGESLTGRMQLLFTSQGVTFEEPGMHLLRAVLDVGDGFGTARSPRARVLVRPASTEAERGIAVNTLDHHVGRAIALGDFGQDQDARRKLEVCAESYPEQDTGAACALVLANGLARGHVDYRESLVRDAAPDEAARYLDLAVRGRSAERMLELATTVASPVERDAPVVADALERVRRARKPRADVSRAATVAAEFVAPSPT